MNIELQTISDFHAIVKDKLPVSNWLYFLDASVWQPGNSKKEEKLLKHIAALANNNGQILVIGIKTKKKRAYQFDYIHFSSFSKIWLEQLIYAQIFPKLEDLKITFLEAENEKGIIVISFKPNHRPYMFSDGRYYSLHEQNIYFLKEDEVRRLYLNQNKPVIEFVGIINTQGIALLENGIPKEINFYPKFIIRNSGTAIEKHYKVEVQIPSCLHDVEFSPLQMHFSRIEGLYTVFTVSSKSPLFQNEIYTIAEAKINLKPNHIDDFINSDIHIIVYYSQGVYKYSFKLNEIFNYNKKLITNYLFKKNSNKDEF